MANFSQLFTCLVFVALCAGELAQGDPGLDDSEFTNEDLTEEVIVTGTRIARRDFNTSSPLTSIDKDVIDFTNQPTLEEALNQMPQVFPAFGRASNNPGDGTAQINLRGLGEGRSLVLLNGRRVAPSGTGNAVDLNNVPRFLIEHIEVITGGTSAVYGSDAIAGVVNFITKGDYEGFGVEAGISIAEEGDAETYEFNAAYGYGFSNGAGNITLYTNFVERKSLLAGNREFTYYPWWDTWEGELMKGGSSRTPEGVVTWPRVDLGSGPDWVIFDPDGTPRQWDGANDWYNFAPVNYLQIPLTRYAVGSMGHYGFTDNVKSYFEASFIRNESAKNLAAVPAELFLSVNLDNPVLVPETQQFFADNYTCDTNLACFQFARRFIESGERFQDWDRDYARIVMGIQGGFSDDWSFDAWVTYTKSEEVTYLRNAVSRSRYQQGLLADPSTGQCYDSSGSCVPLDVFGEGRLSQEGVDFIRHDPFKNITKRTFWLASAYITGAPVETWAGPLDVAMGVEWRSDETHYKSDDALFTGDAMGWRGSSPVSGTERIYEFYGEALIPLTNGKDWAKNLELELGLRYTKTNQSDGYWAYKAGFTWEILTGLTMRAMRQKSVRSPNSEELFTEQRSNDWFWIGQYSEDPCSASSDPVANGMVEKCLIQGLPADQIGVFEAVEYYPVDFHSGGNPDLDPEEAKTWTAGFVIQPASLPEWMFTFDYFQMEVTDTIGQISAAIICFDQNNTGHVFCENILRDETGNAAEFWQLTSNKGMLETRGIDTQVQYQTDLPEQMAWPEGSASFRLNLYWTHLLSWEEQENPATQVTDCTGFYGWPCSNDSNPENRATTNFNYLSGPFEAQLTWRWIRGMDNAATIGATIFGWDEPNLAVPDVSDRSYFDLGFAWTFDDRYQLRFGISNLLDTDPVMMADAVWSNNTDEGLYDVFGRSYYLRLAAQF